MNTINNIRAQTSAPSIILTALTLGIALGRYAALPMWAALTLLAAAIVLCLMSNTGLLRLGYAIVATVLLGATLQLLHGLLPPLSSDIFSSLSLHQWAVDRLSRLGLDGDNQAIVNALGAGERSRISYSLKEAYATSGATHILSVSGLHVGIVFAIIRTALRPLSLVRHGALLRSVAVVAGVWFYVALTGFPPSALRAGVMFSLLQLSLLLSRGYSSLDALFSTAIVMLVFDPSLLFNISFQLSFAAVAGILAWGVPIIGALRVRWRVINYSTSTLIVGVSATVATAPLLLLYFGRASLIGVVVNPLVIVTSTLVLVASIVWLIAPVAALGHILRPALDAALTLQNELVAKSAATGVSAFHTPLCATHTIAIYLFLIAISIGIRAFLKKKYYICQR